MGLLTHLKRLFLPVTVQVTHPYCHCLVDDLTAHSQAAASLFETCAVPGGANTCPGRGL